MPRKNLALGAPLVALALAACPSSTPDAAHEAYKDSPVGPPEGWEGPVFRLSHEYPSEAPPACDPAVCVWLDLEVDFGDGTEPPEWEAGGWAAYMDAILTYVRRGQDPDLADDKGFVTEVDGATRWYHTPWMAYDPTVGREFVHGTTNERTASLGDFDGDMGGGVHALPPPMIKAECAAAWAHGFESWAVAAYNEYGGWVFGRAFPTAGADAGVPQTTTDPQTQRALLAGLPFPPGTVVAKILTTNAPVECVPSLKGSPEWRVHRHKVTASHEYLCAREVAPTRVIQVDVAVVDLRSPTRWVYGTFVYDGDAPGATFWDRLVPLGVQWGSDDQAWPAVKVARDASPPLVQTVLNAPPPTLYEHEGCDGRLAGPVDNRQSSCISCHGGAFSPSPVGTIAVMGENEPPVFGFDGLCDVDLESPEEAWALNSAYFRDSPYPAPYADPAYATAVPLDTSLQLQVALSQYAVFATKQVPTPCTLDQQLGR